MHHSSLLKGASILIVEDDALQALELSDSLEDAGARVIGPAFNIKQASGLVRAESCAAAILEYRLGSQNAGAIAQDLHRLKMPFIVTRSITICTPCPPAGPVAGSFRSRRACPAFIKTVAALVRWKRWTLRPAPSSVM